MTKPVEEPEDETSKTTSMRVVQVSKAMPIGVEQTTSSFVGPILTKIERKYCYD